MKSQALKALEHLSFIHKQRLYSGIPLHALPRDSYSDSDTNGLQTCIVDFIDLCGGWAVRVNTQGQYDTTRQMWRPGNTKKGTPDILACLPDGRFIGIECKRDERDHLSDRQAAIKEDITRANGLHMVAYVGRFHEVYDYIKSLNLE